MSVTKPAQYLLTGSEDTSIIVWDLKTLSVLAKVTEHIAPVLCVTSALNGTVIVSGGEDSSIIISSITNGKVVCTKTPFLLIPTLIDLITEAQNRPPPRFRNIRKGNKRRGRSSER